MNKAIATLLFGLTLSDLTATATASAQRYITVGSGNCLPNRPQWERSHRKIDRQECEDACSGAEACIGYDHYDGGSWWRRTQTCRLRFETDADAASPPLGFTNHTGEEGIGFTGYNNRDGNCYQKNKRQAQNQYIFWGAGNCQPDGPQWYSDKVDSFDNCIDLCDIAETCVGFDYDSKQKACRVRFEDKDPIPSFTHTASPPEGYQPRGGPVSPSRIGFTGVSGASSAECWEKVSPTQLKITWEPCDNEKEFSITGSPVSLTLGQKTTMTGKAVLVNASKQVTHPTSDGWDIYLAMYDRHHRSLMQYECGGDASGHGSLACDLDGGLGSLTFDGLNFPGSSRAIEVKVDIQLAVYRLIRWNVLPVTMTWEMFHDKRAEHLCMKITASLPVDEEQVLASLTSMNKAMSTTTEQVRRLATKMSTTTEQVRRLATKIV